MVRKIAMSVFCPRINASSDGPISSDEKHTVTPCTTKCTIDFTVFLLCAKILKLLVVLSRKNSKAGLLKMSKMKMKTIFENVENFIGIVLEY